MKFTPLIFSTLLLLSACSNTNESPEEQGENNQAQTVEENDETTELSEEEILARDLPENVSADDWNLILVGPTDPLPESFEPSLVEVDNEQRIDARIEEAWYAWRDAAEEAGHNLFFASGYRSVERQKNNFNNSVQGYINEGYSEDEATKKTKEYITEPGHSEHHTGLALDIVDQEWIAAGHGLDPEYDTQASQQWLIETMTDFGFVLRYPKDKEDITNILYESWHFRYVGEENAKFMVENDLTLEEYHELLALRDQ